MGTTESGAPGAESGSRAGLRPAMPVRQKSGLVRQAGGFDAFVFSLSGISVGIMFEWGNFFGTGFYPGGNVLVALLISVAVALAIAWGYQYWGRIFPRSGGDYVFLSRGLHPGFALGVNFVYTWILMVSPSFVMSIKQPLLSSFAAALATATGFNFLTHLSSWFNTNLGYATIGTVDLLVGFGFACLGIKRLIQYMKVLFIVGLAGEVILIPALLLSSSGTFNRNLQKMVGHSVPAIERAATKAGFASSSGFNLHQTLNLTNWYVTSLFFAALLLYIGGEIKNAAQNIRYAMMGAVLFSGIATLVWVLAFNNLVPTSLQGALAWNSAAAPTFSTPGVPYPHVLMQVMWGTSGGGLILTVIAYVSIFCWITLWTPLVIGFAQRAILAWALDGLIPKVFANVNNRWHSTIPAACVAFLMGESFMLLFAFDTSYRTIILLVPLFIGIGLSMAVGTIFPYTRRELLDQSIVADEWVGPVHKMTIWCGIGTIIMAVWTYLMWNDAIASGTDRNPLWVTLGIAVVIAGYYFAFREYQKRRGVDISVTFKRIPTE